jgi:hypothetical protein
MRSARFLAAGAPSLVLTVFSTMLAWLTPYLAGIPFDLWCSTSTYLDHLAQLHVASRP